jgi:hypothetical protein
LVGGGGGRRAAHAQREGREGGRGRAGHEVDGQRRCHCVAQGGKVRLRAPARVALFSPVRLCCFAAQAERGAVLARCSRGARAVLARCSRGARAVLARCSRGARAVLARCSRGAHTHLP